MLKIVAAVCLFTLFFDVRHVCGNQTQQTGDSIIVETNNPRGWLIQTVSSAYQVILTNDKQVQQVYYGPRAQTSFRQKSSQWVNSIDEIPVRGGFADKTPLLEVQFADGVRDCELAFVAARVIAVDGRQTLRIQQKDVYYPLEVISYIRVLPEFDIIEKWVEVKHTGKKSVIQIENLQSASISLPTDRYVLTHMAGDWGHEFQLQSTELTGGVKTLQARDFKSVTNANWFMIRSRSAQSDTSGGAWFGTLQYSGNWRMDFDMAFNKRLQVTGGINFWDTKWNLAPGTAFTTPKFILGYTQSGSEGSSHHLREYIRETLLPSKWKDKPRPVLYNSWYATTFDVNEQQQLKLAQLAKDIGVELFVIDDGWFNGRNDDKGGLGDWTVDKKKFPNGLQPMIRKINDMGMDFGIWVEPEMVNRNSDLYRAHPDWAFSFPNRTSHEIRNQLTLNLAREDVYRYLLESLTKLLRENNIKFLKWDHNRALSEPGWPDAPLATQREVRIRYIDNLYRLVDSLRSRFPDVQFEDCSSGGGRVDLGMLSRMHQAWASDNTDPTDRLFIQYGYLSAFPANTMVGWVTDEDWHQQNPSLDYRFDVSMGGVLGIGSDITKWNDEQKTKAREKIARYKEIRSLVQFGHVYRLRSPFEENKVSFQYVSDDRSSAVLMCYNMAEYLAGSVAETRTNQSLTLQGLDAEASYTIPQLGDQVYTGDFLMRVGIAWPVKGAYKSSILDVRKVTK